MTSTGACGGWCQNYASDQWGGSTEFDSLAGAPPIWPFIYEVTRQTTITYRGENGQIYRMKLTDVWYENSYGAYLGRKQPGANTSPNKGISTSQDDGLCEGVAGFTADIGRFSATELNDAAITVFGEISAVLRGDSNDLWAEAWAIASVIFNRSDAINKGIQGDNPFGKTASLTDVVTATDQFKGYDKGLRDIRRGITRENEMYEGQRNCIRLYIAIEAVRHLASGVRRAPFLFFVSNFIGKRRLKPGQFRFGGNDFSRNPISIR